MVRSARSKLYDGEQSEHFGEIGQRAGKVITDLKTDMDLIKERLLDMRQIKELLLEFKKGKTPSDGGENSVNRDKKAEENSDNNGSREDSEEEEPNYHSYKISISELKHGRLKSSKNILEVKREESKELVRMFCSAFIPGNTFRCLFSLYTWQYF